MLDASQSMIAIWDGSNRSRMDVAKDILTKIVDSLRVDPSIEIALRVYGHRFSRQVNNCNDSKLEVPFAARNHAAIINRVKEITPIGVTPITYSITEAAKDFPAGPGYRNMVILITDGIESCGADPCAASLELQRKGIFLRPYIIGLGLESGKALDCVGQFLDASSPREFHHLLNKVIEKSFAKTTISVHLLDGAGQPIETNVDVSFINNFTGTSHYEFVHYLNPLRQADSVQVDPILNYNIVVNTLPPVTHPGTSIQQGQHNVIEIKVPQGNLTINSASRGVSFPSIIRQKGSAATVHVQPSGATVRYLAGDYEIETLTLPRKTFPVSIEPGKNQTVTLPPTGLVNINTVAKGVGTLFVIDELGVSRMVCELDKTASFHSYHLLPGNYKVAFRSALAPGSKYTAVKTFTVTSGGTVNIRMF